jgi:hypothetical protein
MTVSQDYKNRLVTPLTAVPDDSVKEDFQTEVKYPITTESYNPSFSETISGTRYAYSSGIVETAAERFLVDTQYETEQGFNVGNKDVFDLVTAGLTNDQIERYQGNFTRAKSLEHAKHIRKNIDSFIKLEQASQNAEGFSGWAGYIVGAGLGVATDPLNLIFGAGLFNKVYKGVNAVIKSGKISGAVAGATLNVTNLTASNVLTQGSYSMTDEEYQAGLVLGTALGAGIGTVLGGAIKFNEDTIREAQEFAQDFKDKRQLSTLRENNTKKFMEEGIFGDAVMKTPDGQIVPKTDQTIGAMRTPVQEQVDVKLAEAQNDPSFIRKWLFKAAELVTEKVLPKYAMMGSMYKSAREYIYKMSPFEAKLTVNNPNLPAETLRDVIEAEYITAIRAGEHEALTMAVKYNPDINLSKLIEEADISMKTNTPSKNPGVKFLVENHIQPMLKQMHDEAVARGFFKARDLEGGYYYPLVVDTQKLLNNIPTAKIQIAEGMKVQANKRLNEIRQEGLQARKTLQALKDQAKKEIEEINQGLKQVADDYKVALNNISLMSDRFLDDTVESSIRDLLFALGREAEVEGVLKAFKTNNTFTHLEDAIAANKWDEMSQEYIENKVFKNLNQVTSTTFKPSQFKHLELHVDRSYVKDFISDRNYLEQLRAYITDHARAVAKYDTYGDLNGENVTAKLKQEYLDLIKGLDPESKKYKKLTTEYQKAVEYIKAINARFDGTKLDGSRAYDAGDAVYDTVSTFTTAKLLSQSAIAQIADWGGPLVRAGFGRFNRFHKQALEILGQDMKVLTGDDYKLVAATLDGIDWRMLTRNEGGLTPDTALSKFNPKDLGTYLPAIGKGNRKAQALIYQLNLMSPMNNIARMIMSEKATRNIVEAAIVGVKNIPQDKLDNLAQYGITSDDLTNIVYQFEKHSTEKNGYRYANISKWDTDIRRKVFGAVKAEVDVKHIITPTLTTKSLWIDNAFGRFFGKLQGFMMQAMESYGLAALQRGGSEEAMVFMMRNVLGSLSYVMRAAINKPWEEVDTSPERLLFEGLSRGGTDMGLGFVGMQLDGLSAMTGFKLGPRAITGMQRNRNFGAPTIEQMALGASGVFVKDLNELLQSTGRDRFTKVATKQIGEYATPWNNPVTKIARNMYFGYDN